MVESPAVNDIPDLPDSQLLLAMAVPRNRIRIEEQTVGSPSIGERRFIGIDKETIPVRIGNHSAQIIKVFYSIEPLLPSTQIYRPADTLQIHLQAMPEHVKESAAVILFSG